MKTFTDTKNRTWNLEINVGTCRRVRSLLQVDLPNITQGDPPLLQRLGTDVILLVDVIFCCCKPQADGQGITDQDFAEAFGGDTASLAADLFWEELSEFFRRDRRPDQAAAIEKQRTLVRSVTRAAQRKIEAIDVEKIIETEMGKQPTTGEPSGDSPDSSESIPIRSRSAS